MTDGQDTNKDDTDPTPRETVSIGKIDTVGGILNVGRVEAISLSTFPRDKAQLREWWHSILRHHGHYECYGMFLTLPADKEALRYLTDLGRELDLITADDCLVIALGKTEFRVTGFNSETWRKSIQEQTDEGYSVKIAQLFGLDFAIFPCLLIFRDIRSPRHIVISLAEMTAEQIADEMRSIFSIIHKAVANKNSPLDAIAEHQHSEKLLQRRKSMVSKATGFAGKTFETAMEAWIGAIIK